ncbi:M1 family metallopeptidase [Nocardioides marmoribigeumensis]|uniref:Aminopeptidase N n=1 Tax=Nocardioides marmoribigeumensis TaxID=433649 RepID=A0ABU2BS32_9ACTN|nr:M1 family metallopeptidase [Nocardioides marmoribigeumensis]MDR7361428.1 aminopeptidase N [Nocardioides marmoribigeumensis]
MSHHRPAVALLCAASLALSLGALGPLGARGGAAAVAAEATAVVGSPDGPDAYFPRDGNGGYQVTHYTIDDRVQPSTDALSGRTTLRAVAGSSALSAFHLDLRLTPDAVTVDGEPATFSKPSGHELEVTPRTPVAAGSPFTVAVRYHGTPSRLRSATAWDGYFHQPGETAAVGEPQIGPWWFAANETPRDKATFDITIRVPTGQQAVSGGRLVSRTVSGDWTAWRWKVDEAISTYLAYFVAGRFEIRRTTADGRPVLYAVSRQLSAKEVEQAFALLDDTPRILRWMESRFGAYPYATAGGVVSSVYTGFALENASRPFYSWFGSSAGTVVVHELAHQWFGDTVALQRWRDTWLNEGFATYVEWLWQEGHGRRSVQDTLTSRYDSYVPSSTFWDLQVSNPGPTEIFSTPVYDRGGMMLGALRCRIGKAPMRDLVRAWVDRHRDGTGTGRQFRDLAAAREGAGLSTFFHTWLDVRERPARTRANGLTGCS